MIARRIALSGERGSGLYAVVDEEDYGWLSSYKWHLTGISSTGIRYAGRACSVDEGKPGEKITMHREVLGLRSGDSGVRVDHLNDDGLDNRRANLRVCTHAQNIANMKPRDGKRFKGVRWLERYGYWEARIKYEFTEKWLGAFDSEEAAARAYDVSAVEYFGEFARLNFPGDVERSRTLAEAGRRPPQKRLTAMQRADLIRAREEVGLSFDVLGTAFGITGQSAYRICKAGCG